MNLLPLACTACCMLLAACTRPQPPDKERPPEPQAATVVHGSAPAPALRTAVQAPLDTARSAQDQLRKDADAARSAIEAAGG